MWANPQKTVTLFTFAQEMLNGKLHYLAVIFTMWKTIWLNEEYVFLYDQTYRNKNWVLNQHSQVLIKNLRTKEIAKVNLSLNSWEKDKTSVEDNFNCLFESKYTMVLKPHLGLLKLYYLLVQYHCALLEYHCALI